MSDVDGRNVLILDVGFDGFIGFWGWGSRRSELEEELSLGSGGIEEIMWGYS